MDDGPCIFCTACGGCTTTQPSNLPTPCVGRKGKTAAGLAALVRFHSVVVPDCGGKCGRRVYAVEVLPSGASDLWAGIPRSEVVPSCLTRGRSGRGLNPPAGAVDRLRRGSAERDKALLATKRQPL